MNESSSDNLKASLVIPFACAEHALIAYNTLSVDQEPRRELISKRLSISSTDASLLEIEWSAKEARVLRVSLNSLIDHLHLVLETIHEFDN